MEGLMESYVGPGTGHIGQFKRSREYKTLDKHVAESKWQYCNCKSCQDIRFRIEEAPPGTKFNFDTYRRKDEKY